MGKYIKSFSKPGAGERAEEPGRSRLGPGQSRRAPRGQTTRPSGGARARLPGRCQPRGRTTAGAHLLRAEALHRQGGRAAQGQVSPTLDSPARDRQPAPGERRRVPERLRSHRGSPGARPTPRQRATRSRAPQAPAWLSAPGRPATPTARRLGLPLGERDPVPPANEDARKRAASTGPKPPAVESGYRSGARHPSQGGVRVCSWGEGAGTAPRRREQGNERPVTSVLGSALRSLPSGLAETAAAPPGPRSCEAPAANSGPDARPPNTRRSGLQRLGPGKPGGGGARRAPRAAHGTLGSVVLGDLPRPPRVPAPRSLRTRRGESPGTGGVVLP